MPTNPKPLRPLEGTHNKKYTLRISEDAMYEFTEALRANNIQLTGNEDITITKDMAVTGPYNYRQVNLRHQILIEAVKVYKSPINANEMEYNNAQEFIKFIDDVYQYVLTGMTEQQSDTETKPKSAVKGGW